ncbi:hypothetical protein ACFC0M_00595 [Streptomyces sp. NPDC056149]|uniref:MmyB family transcriptional regulator n=1 Tax=Streptomyces sp. NPDC056149 TaxID=3345728 RepID=UPI0035D81105
MARRIPSFFTSWCNRNEPRARPRFLHLGHPTRRPAHSAARELLAEWSTAARGAVAVLHLYAGRHRHDPRLTELVGELSVHDEDFRRWWADHDVLQYTHGTKHYHHPLVGELALDYESLPLPDDPDQALYLYTAEPCSPSADALRLLSSWSAPDLTAGNAASESTT